MQVGAVTFNADLLHSSVTNGTPRQVGCGAKSSLLTSTRRQSSFPSRSRGGSVSFPAAILQQTQVLCFLNCRFERGGRIHFQFMSQRARQSGDKTLLQLIFSLLGRASALRVSVASPGRARIHPLIHTRVRIFAPPEVGARAFFSSAYSSRKLFSKRRRGRRSL